MYIYRIRYNHEEHTEASKVIQGEYREEGSVIAGREFFFVSVEF
jgi:hypothetical protein